MARAKTDAETSAEQTGSATSKADELRQLSDEELLTRHREAKEELFNLRFQQATGQLDNNRRIRTVKRDIARVLTVMTERELGIYVRNTTGAGAA